MRYFLVQDQTALDAIDDVDEIAMYPVSSVLGLTSRSTTTVRMDIQGTADLDANDEIIFNIADLKPTGLQTTENKSRLALDLLVQFLNGDYKGAVGVLFDNLNNDGFCNNNNMAANYSEQN